MSSKYTSDGSESQSGDESERPSRKDCQKAIKILTQYERLAQKFRKQIGTRRIAELNRLREAGMITINHLPGILRSEFPIGIFDHMTLSEIREWCEM
ncbi:MAG: hypothetical protein AB4352_04355 [Hormoscilla sp.]